MRKKPKIDYPVATFRLDKETVARLQNLRGNMSWNKFFLSIVREKEGECCYFCSKVGELEIHHIVAKKDGGGDEKENLMLLCVSCHRKTENWGNKKKI